MKSELIEILETLGFPVFLQGSLNSTEEYPDNFFTFWNFDTPEAAYYSDNPNRAIWGFWIYFYSIDPANVETIAENARQLLKQHGWILQGKPQDIQTDAVTHTGVFFTVYKFENYTKEG
jgi:hypothetical protein